MVADAVQAAAADAQVTPGADEGGEGICAEELQELKVSAHTCTEHHKPAFDGA